MRTLIVVLLTILGGLVGSLILLAIEYTLGVENLFYIFLLVMSFIGLIVNPIVEIRKYYKKKNSINI